MPSKPTSSKPLLDPLRLFPRASELSKTNKPKEGHDGNCQRSHGRIDAVNRDESVALNLTLLLGLDILNNRILLPELDIV